MNNEQKTAALSLIADPKNPDKRARAKLLGITDKTGNLDQATEQWATQRITDLALIELGKEANATDEAKTISKAKEACIRREDKGGTFYTQHSRRA